MNYIKKTPYSRPLVQDHYLASLGIRSIKVKHYVIYFNVDENEKRINVIRFFYNKRNWIKLLKESNTEDYFKNLSEGTTQEEEYPPLIKKLSGIISENDLNKLSKNNDRVKYILKEKT